MAQAQGPSLPRPTIPVQLVATFGPFAFEKIYGTLLQDTGANAPLDIGAALRFENDAIDAGTVQF